MMIHSAGQFAARLVGIALVLALMGGFWWLISEVSREKIAEEERISVAQNCTEWQHGSRADKLLDGPHEADRCRHYFETRTQAEAKRDAAYWQEMLEDARRDWDRAGSKMPEEEAKPDQ
jgi:hypothetical protein